MQVIPATLPQHQCLEGFYHCADCNELALNSFFSWKLLPSGSHFAKEKK